MIKRVKQIKITEIDNNPSNIFSQEQGEIHKIGIQGPPRTTFSLNGNPFIIGNSGILEFEDNQINFNNLVFSSTNNIFDLQENSIYVDYIITEGV